MFRILVVEDDADLNEAVCTYLRKNGFDADGCYNTTQAYSALYNNVHDLIVSDIMMPGEDGFEFAKKIRNLSTNIPIMFITARDDLASKQLGFSLGIDDYMVKPVDEVEMILRIKALLRRAEITNKREINLKSTKLVYDSFSVIYKGKETVLPKKEFLEQIFLEQLE